MKPEFSSGTLTVSAKRPMFLSRTLPQIFLVALFAPMIVFFFLHNKEDNEARLAGWANQSDRALAELSGFSDPAAWRAKQDAEAVKRAEAQAEAQKQEIVGLQRRLATTPATDFKDIETIYARLKVLEPSNRTYEPKIEAAKRGYWTCRARGDTDASDMSEHFVRDRLKAPATAEFPRRPYGVTWVGGCTFKVNSYVDAQNGFGAKLRNKYFAELEYLPTEDKWRLKSLLLN
jgi:hypothetical protein